MKNYKYLLLFLFVVLTFIPIRVRADTFGYTTVGGSTYTLLKERFDSYLATSAAGTNVLNSITQYSKTTTGTADFKGVMVLHSNLNIISGGVANTAGTFNTVAAWATSSYSSPPSLSASTEYVIGYICNADTVQNYNAIGTALEHYDSSNSYTTPTNPTDALTYNNFSISIYATYTPSGGGSPTNTGCFHLGGDWYVDQTCWIGSSTTTSGTLYLTETAQLNCIDGATISVVGIKAKGGTKINAKGNCKIKIFKPSP